MADTGDKLYHTTRLGRAADRVPNCRATAAGALHGFAAGAKNNLATMPEWVGCGGRVQRSMSLSSYLQYTL